MMIEENIQNILSQLPRDVRLVAVSKFHPFEAVLEAYSAGQRIFGESRPQELYSKALQLPQDIQWHFIGHLQTNKLKFVLPYVSMVESVDSAHLLDEMEKWGAANGKVIPVLLELHIAVEETKQGFVEEELMDVLFRAVAGAYPHIRFCGLMGMASNTPDMETVEADFARISDFKAYLDDLFPELEDFKELSIGMSNDWKTALRYGATLVRIGSAIFGERDYSKTDS